MKTLFFTIVTVLALTAGTRTAQMNSASAQAGVFRGPVMPITDPFAAPLTNNLPFTNTLVQVTNVPQLQFSNVLALLLNLQTNIEVSLPVLSFLTTNINTAASAPTNLITGSVMPITSNPPGLLTPTGAATGNPAQPLTFSMTVGTNTFMIDPPTFQGLVMLRDDLARALPVLQALNGTSPTNLTTVTGTPPVTVNTLAPVAVNTLAPPPVRTGFFTPLTNGPPPLVRGL